MCVLRDFRAFSSFRFSVQCVFLCVDLELQDCVVGCCWGLDFAGIRPTLFLGLGRSLSGIPGMSAFKWQISSKPKHIGRQAVYVALPKRAACYFKPGILSLEPKVPKAKRDQFQFLMPQVIFGVRPVSEPSNLLQLPWILLAQPK